MIYQCFTKGRGSKEFSYDTSGGSYIKSPFYVFIGANGKREEVNPGITKVTLSSTSDYEIFNPKTMQRADVRVIEAYNVADISLTGNNESIKGFCYNKNVEFNLYNCGEVSISCKNNVNVYSCGSVNIHSLYLSDDYTERTKPVNNVTIKKCGYLSLGISSNLAEKKALLKQFKKKFSDIYSINAELSESEKREFNTKCLYLDEKLNSLNGLEQNVQGFARGYECFCYNISKGYSFSGSDTIPSINVSGYKVLITEKTMPYSDKTLILVYKSDKALQNFMENSPAAVLGIFCTPTASKLGAHIEWIKYPTYKYAFGYGVTIPELFFSRLKGFKNYLPSSSYSSFMASYSSHYNPVYDFSSLELAYLPLIFFHQSSLIRANIKKIRCKREMAIALINHFQKYNNSLTGRDANENKVKIENITWEYSD